MFVCLSVYTDMFCNVYNEKLTIDMLLNGVILDEILPGVDTEVDGRSVGQGIPSPRCETHSFMTTNNLEHHITGNFAA